MGVVGALGCAPPSLPTMLPCTRSSVTESSWVTGRPRRSLEGYGERLRVCGQSQVAKLNDWIYLELVIADYGACRWRGLLRRRCCKAAGAGDDVWYLPAIHGPGEALVKMSMAG